MTQEPPGTGDEARDAPASIIACRGAQPTWLRPYASRVVPRGSCLAARASRRAGFTLIELVIVVAIVGILALGLIPLGELAVKRSREAELRDALRTIRTALDAYKKAWDEGRMEKKATDTGYPPNLEVLVNGVKDIKTPEGTKIYFLRRIPRDPLNEDTTLPPAKTWGLRSYASPPGDPAPGDDVFDVYSKSQAKGLNGVPYRQW